jgi:hypothetical protein
VLRQPVLEEEFLMVTLIADVFYRGPFDAVYAAGPPASAERLIGTPVVRGVPTQKYLVLGRWLANWARGHDPRVIFEVYYRPHGYTKGDERIALEYSREMCGPNDPPITEYVVSSCRYALYELTGDPLWKHCRYIKGRRDSNFREGIAGREGWPLLPPKAPGADRKPEDFPLLGNEHAADTPTPRPGEAAPRPREPRDLPLLPSHEAAWSDTTPRAGEANGAVAHAGNGHDPQRCYLVEVHMLWHYEHSPVVHVAKQLLTHASTIMSHQELEEVTDVLYQRLSNTKSSRVVLVDSYYLVLGEEPVTVGVGAVK